MKEFIITQGRFSDEPCPVCGKVMLIGNVCNNKHTSKRNKIGKYSGPSKNFKGKYENK